MTWVEFSLYLEGVYRRHKYEAESKITLAWTIAKLSKSKRIPPLSRMLRFKDKAQKLSPEEAAKEKARHEALVQRLASDATGTEDDLKAFIERQNREFIERTRAPRPEDKS